MLGRKRRKAVLEPDPEPAGRSPDDTHLIAHDVGGGKHDDFPARFAAEGLEQFAAYLASRRDH